MKHTRYVFILAIVAAAAAGSVVGQTIVTLDGPQTDVYEDCTNRFHIRYAYEPGDGSAITAFSNGFRIWTTNNGYTDRPGPILRDTLPIPGGWANAMGGGVFYSAASNDGLTEDTVGFGAFRLFTPGLVDPFDEKTFRILVPVGAQAGDTLCIDSAFFEPIGEWMWSASGSFSCTGVPDWGGPYCWEILPCCPSPNICNLGACCLPGDSCVEMLEDSCAAAGGTYLGDGTICSPISCTPFPPGPDNDSSTSLGVFRIYIDSMFRPLIQDWATVMSIPPCGSTITQAGCYDGLDTNRLTSPLLFDRGTIIARSDPHLDGSAPDNTGAPTGAGPYATTVGDADMQLLPPFEGPAGRTEVHTAVAAFEMEDFGSGVMVRAGHSLGLPLSPGEVESKAGQYFPGESFFNVFVEVTLPGLGSPPETAILDNSDPLLIVNDSLTELPPKIVYIHDNTSAVPIRFANSHSGGDWNAGDLLGYLVLAGHGYRFDMAKKDPGDINLFLDIMNEHLAQDGEMPITTSCCNGDGIRGNVDGVTGVGGPIDVADLSYLVDYLFRGGPVPPCIDEANIDGVVGVGGPIDVADLSYIVDYLFRGGPTPAACP